MPSTHVSLHYHLIFSTKDRRSFISPGIRPRLHAYLGGIVRTLAGTALEIGGPDDHVHLLVGLKATHVLADVMRVLKAESSKWVHGELGLSTFARQEGYGAFTASRSDVSTVRGYVQEQEEHHRTRSFQDEYRQLLLKHEIEFDERYLW